MQRKEHEFLEAYGKGKSHIILNYSFPAYAEKNNFFYTFDAEEINREYPELKQLVDNYYSDKNNTMPVIINGTKAAAYRRLFLLALQSTLLMRMV